MNQLTLEDSLSGIRVRWRNRPKKNHTTPREPQEEPPSGIRVRWRRPRQNHPSLRELQEAMEYTVKIMSDPSVFEFTAAIINRQDPPDRDRMATDAEPYDVGWWKSQLYYLVNRTLDERYLGKSTLPLDPSKPHHRPVLAGWDFDKHEIDWYIRLFDYPWIGQLFEGYILAFVGPGWLLNSSDVIPAHGTVAGYNRHKSKGGVPLDNSCGCLAAKLRRLAYPFGDDC